MANLTGGAIAAGNTEYNLASASQEVTKAVFDLGLVRYLMENGAIRDYSIKASSQQSDTIKLPNVAPFQTFGRDSGADMYTSEGTMEYGQRTLTVAEYRDVIKFKKPETIDKVRDSHDLLGKHDIEALATSVAANIEFGILQHVAGNTATSTINPVNNTAAYTGTALPRCRLMTATTAQAANAFHYGSNAALANNGAITATNALLTMQDLQKANRYVENFTAGVTPFPTLKKGGYRTVGIGCSAARDQLINQAQGTNADATVNSIALALLSGGKAEDRVYGLNMLPIAALDMMIIIKPDSMVSKAVNAGAENALSRCFTVLGDNALDFAMADATGLTSGLPTAVVEVDDLTFKLNDWNRAAVRAKFAGVKRQMNGYGANAATLYDAAVYNINHSY